MVVRPRSVSGAFLSTKGTAWRSSGSLVSLHPRSLSSGAGYCFCGFLRLQSALGVGGTLQMLGKVHQRSLEAAVVYSSPLEYTNLRFWSAVAPFSHYLLGRWQCQSVSMCLFWWHGGISLVSKTNTVVLVWVFRLWLRPLSLFASLWFLGFFLSEPVAFRRVYGLESHSRTSGESNHHRQSVSDFAVVSWRNVGARGFLPVHHRPWSLLQWVHFWRNAFDPLSLATEHEGQLESSPCIEQAEMWEDLLKHWSCMMWDPRSWSIFYLKGEIQFSIWKPETGWDPQHPWQTWKMFSIIVVFRFFDAKAMF